MLNMITLIGIDDLDPKLQICELALSKLNIVIMNIVLGINDLDPKL